jgi:serine phosphatase RsbU (regulator of sigma subunit)
MKFWRRRRRNVMRQLVAAMPARALAPGAAAIFLLFSMMGFLVDVMAGGTMPPALIASNVLFSGVLALLYAYGALVHWSGTAIAVPIQIVYWRVMPRLFPEAGIPPVLDRAHLRLRFDALAVIICISVSYALFRIFVTTSGRKFLDTQAEIRLAHEIHAVLVPPIDTRIGEYDFVGFSIASGDVGGDLVDVVALEAGDTAAGRDGGDTGALRWIGYIADVSGHGVSSGVLMGMAKSAARMRFRRNVRPDAGTGMMAGLLDDLNAVLYYLKRPAMFVTFAGVSDDGSGELEFSVAGHLPILQVTRDGAVRQVTTPQIPLGMFEDRRFVSSRLACAPDDLLVLVTDGLTEVFDREDREFGLERLESYIGARANQPLQEIASGLLEQVRAHGPQLDDQTALFIRRRV